jgi:glutaredoxin
MRKTVLVAAAVSLLLGTVACSRKEHRMDSFAQCLAQRGATMYGAYWCPHCKDQKDEFGESFKYVKYVECSIPGRPTRIQTPACEAKKVTQYPTWIFADGSRMDGVESMQQLAGKTGCPIPPPEK